jgi:hypothetical protein
MLDILSKLDSSELVGCLAIICGTLVLVTAIIGKQWRKIRQTELDNAMRRDLLDRGMSPEEIARVLNAEPAKAVAYPAANEVVVEQDGDWYPGILLKTDGQKYLVHYKGYDEEEWVTLDRIRFPAASPATSPQAQAQPQVA